MNAQLTFKLPEEQEEFNRCTHADNLCSFIWEFEQWLRREAKYVDLDGVKAEDYIDKIRDKWWEMKGEEGVNLDELWT